MQIKVQDLWKVFYTVGGKVEALRGIDLDVKNSEVLGIIGVSGSGKSTLLHIVGTLDRPTYGEVYYDEKNVFFQKDGNISFFRNREIGFIFQFHYLLPEFTALENVMMPCLINGLSVDQAKEMAINVLNRVGLKDRLDHRPGELSGGEQQRVAIARAVVLSPKVILADEPTGNLDLYTGASILDLFLKLNGEYGMTSIIVTHNLEMAKRLDRRIILSNGRIVDEH